VVLSEDQSSGNKVESLGKWTEDAEIEVHNGGDSLVSDMKNQQRLRFAYHNGRVTTFWSSNWGDWNGPYFGSLINNELRFETDHSDEFGRLLVNSLPAFGVSLNDTVHLWDVHEHKVFLFKYTDLSGMDNDKSIHVKETPFDGYFACTNKEVN